MRKLFAFGCLVLVACMLGCDSEDDPKITADNFDRKALLENWADNIILPSYTEYVASVANLDDKATIFVDQPSVESLEALKMAWQEAYLAWQWVSMFEIGKAEAITLRDFTNTYPTNTVEIDNSISTGTYNLALASSRTTQGFPALDYLLFGIASGNEETLNTFNENANYGEFLLALTSRLKNLAVEVQSDWTNGYRDTFVNDTGSTANSSVNKLVNDYMFYYEKALRAGKVGIPAGIFSNTVLPDRVEAFYNKQLSKTLLLEALNASYNFFNGIAFGGSTNGVGLDDYLQYVNAIADGEALDMLINQQFEAAEVEINKLDSDLSNEVLTNNQAMLKAYDELQKNVVLKKVDMFQALNIQVDFVDADGD